MIDQVSAATPPTRKGGLIILSLFGIVWSGFTLTADWFIFGEAVRQIIAESYSTIAGRVRAAA